jgi:hypothetical protein
MEELTPFQKFKEEIVNILKTGPKTTPKIRSKIKDLYPEEESVMIGCDAFIEMYIMAVRNGNI